MTFIIGLMLMLILSLALIIISVSLVLSGHQFSVWIKPLLYCSLLLSFISVLVSLVGIGYA